MQNERPDPGLVTRGQRVQGVSSMQKVPRGSGLYICMVGTSFGRLGMARPLRIEFEGALYHLMARGMLGLTSSLMMRIGRSSSTMSGVYVGDLAGASGPGA